MSYENVPTMWKLMQSRHIAGYFPAATVLQQQLYPDNQLLWSTYMTFLAGEPNIVVTLVNVDLDVPKMAPVAQPQPKVELLSM
jgi:hypothetical protein